MKRIYIVAESFYASRDDGNRHEFKLGEALCCDLQQSGGELEVETRSRRQWFVDRQTFEQCCRLARTGAKCSCPLRGGNFVQNLD